MKTNNTTGLVIVVSILFMAIPRTASAQLKGENIPGDFGLQSGTQAPPAIMLAVPLYFYNSSKYKKSDGGTLGSPEFNMFFTGIGASIVTNIKVFNANWGATLILPFASNRVEGNLVNTDAPFKYTDTYIQPIQLGWHLKQADFVAAYGLFIPTGKYELGGDGNSGLGMWSQELQGGTTLFFNKQKTFHFSTLLSYEVHSDKKDTDIKTGDILTIEGGLGKTWYHKTSGPIPIVINAGFVYYMQYKLSSDEIPVGNTVFYGDKDHVYGWGAEGNVFLPAIRSQLGIRWLGESGARNRFQGNTFFISIAYMLKSLAAKKE